ncbi:MAG: GGDEF domain-containing protein [Gammaproteobacteria bacterium]|nr:GGDEF domain-containing protein [Gammaproteobacteria bacterium]
MNRSFSGGFEAEYLRGQLLGNRKLIRVTCVLAVMLAAVRGLEQLLTDGWPIGNLILVAVVLVASAALAAIAWSRSFERVYLPVAQIVVPARNMLAAFSVAGSTALGQPEVLMILPLMVLGPFFFMGLSFRVALTSVVLTLAAFVAGAVWFGLAAPVTVRSSMLLAMSAAACAIAARHLERWSRTSFLESHLIAELAEHDALTGLKNRRVFDDQLVRLWQKAIDEERTLAVVLIDVDQFKAYNDVYGHQAGDQALRRVAQALRSLVARPHDVLARYGGEEFVVILYDLDARRAEALAERMRVAVAELGIEHRATPSGSITISAGVAVVEPSRERRSRGALQLADQALYEAKLQGRNRVEIMDQDAYSVLVTGVFADGR